MQIQYYTNTPGLIKECTDAVCARARLPNHCDVMTEFVKVHLVVDHTVHLLHTSTLTLCT
jgi:hypothetical protein